MKSVAAAAFVVFIFACTALAEMPDQLLDGGPPAPEGLSGWSMPAEEGEGTFTGDEDASLSEPGAMPADYYTQRMLTVEGVITAIDTGARTITIKDAEEERTYVYDELTRFQVRLNPVEPSELKVGSKMAGLYTERVGGDYIGRVVIITGVKDVKKKSTRKKRRRRR